MSRLVHGLATVSILAALSGLALGESGPLPKGVIKPKKDGTVPTAVWLAECATLFEEFVKARQDLDELVEAGGFAADPAGLENAINRQTVPAAKATVDFCTAYVPDTKWGEQLRLEIIDATVSSLAADAHIVDVLEGKAESKAPIVDVLTEQKEIRNDLIAEVHRRILNAPKKYRLKPEELTPSREYYFQDFRQRGRP
ncbi:MAG: hypothetical protein GTN49_11190 [candidate division Zixibacteria bacterium]|nr:hypothetical protein [candidate division Zixibacteria bacterium]